MISKYFVVLCSTPVLSELKNVTAFDCSRSIASQSSNTVVLGPGNSSSGILPSAHALLIIDSRLESNDQMICQLIHDINTLLLSPPASSVRSAIVGIKLSNRSTKEPAIYHEATSRVRSSQWASIAASVPLTFMV